MARRPSISIEDWLFSETEERPSPENYPLFVGNSIIETAKARAQAEAKRHGLRLDGPLAASYVSYWLQVLKDLNTWWLYNRAGRVMGSDDAINVAIAKGQPWRLTAQFIDFMNAELGSAIRPLSSESECLKKFEDNIDNAVGGGAIYTFTRYEKVSHFVMDLAYDAGWNREFNSVHEFKQREGVERDIERATVHRAMSLYLASCAAKRGTPQCIRHLMLFGFPEVYDHIQGIKDSTLVSLAQYPPKKVSRFLLSDLIASDYIQRNADNIARGALSMLRL